jgi:RNA polymerase sigma-70 factor (ECF subfamily)
LSAINQDIERLIDLCRKGDEHAQLEVYKRYYKAMYNTSLRIVRDTAEAEDIMQESFLTAFTKLDKLKDNASFGAWLKRIVINNSIGQYQKDQKIHSTGLDDVIYKISETPADTEVNTSIISTNQIKAAINELKESYAVGLTLHLIEGYDYDEISEILNISNGNCRTLISRAKTQLRQKLAPQIPS